MLRMVSVGPRSARSVVLADICLRIGYICLVVIGSRYGWYSLTMGMNVYDTEYAARKHR